jgi:hypothetical protein
MDPNNYELNYGSDVLWCSLVSILCCPVSTLIWHDYFLYHKSFQSVSTISEVKISFLLPLSVFCNTLPTFAEDQFLFLVKKSWLKEKNTSFMSINRCMKFCLQLLSPNQFQTFSRSVSTGHIPVVKTNDVKMHTNPYHVFPKWRNHAEIHVYKS